MIQAKVGAPGTLTRRTDELYRNYHEALNRLDTALTNFDGADPEHIDIAIYELHAAELRVGAALRSVKEVNKEMGEARRRKLAGDTKPRGIKWREKKPSRFVKWLSVSTYKSDARK